MTDKAKSEALFEQQRQMTKAWEAQMEALNHDESVKSNGLQNQPSYATIPPKGVVAMRKEYYQGAVSVRATQKYKDKIGMQKITIEVQAGSREALNAEAKSRGVSATQLIVDAVNAYIGREIISNKKQ